MENADIPIIPESSNRKPFYSSCILQAITFDAGDMTDEKGKSFPAEKTGRNKALSTDQFGLLKRNMACAAAGPTDPFGRSAKGPIA